MRMEIIPSAPRTRVFNLPLIDSNEDPFQYRKMAGKLMYLTISRPDITFPVNKLSQCYLCREPLFSYYLSIYGLNNY